jgi:uncharacterized protein (UPF0210 family)
MKIRSITCFLSPGWPLDPAVLRRAGEFIAAAIPAFETAGYEVQTCRLATPSFARRLGTARARQVVEYAVELEGCAQEDGFSYVSLGPALPELPASYAVIPQVIAATRNVFLSGLLTTPGGGISLPAARLCAEVIERNAPLEPDGFANLRFAALANVPPGTPFFPAGYFDPDRMGPGIAFALATEAADLAVEAFSGASSLEQARQALVMAVENHAAELAGIAGELARRHNLGFGGLDFTLAPFPQDSLSIGAAMERLGLPAVGWHGSLTAAAILTDTLDRAEYRRAGFNGLFLPVLEDACLATRAAQGVLTVKDLLLYSAVCGTGLDTVPLPGDTTAGQIYPVLLDLAALSQRLDKPLTARLMPVPGKRAGDLTGFDFSFFANSRVMALEAEPLDGLLAGAETLRLQPRLR